jgi:hypothetical protein
MDLLPEKRMGEAARGSIILGILKSVHPYEGRKRVEVLKRDKKDTAQESLCSVFEVY